MHFLLENLRNKIKIKAQYFAGTVLFMSVIVTLLFKCVLICFNFLLLQGVLLCVVLFHLTVGFGNTLCKTFFIYIFTKEIADLDSAVFIRLMVLESGIFKHTVDGIKFNS